MILDPTIYYILVVSDGRPEQATPLAGFSWRLCGSAFLLRAVGGLPTDVFEPAADISKISLEARRANGLAALNLSIQSPHAARYQPPSIERPFTLILLGPEDDAAPFIAWAKAEGGPITIVASQGGDMGYANLTFEGLRTRFMTLCGVLEGRCNALALAEVWDALRAWTDKPRRDLPYKVGGHASITPNLQALRSLGFADPTVGPFRAIGQGTQPYVDQIVVTAKSVLDGRAAIPATMGDAYCPRRPAINLFAPAMFTNLSIGLMQEATAQERRQFQMVKSQLERQDGYSMTLGTAAQAKAAFGIDPNVEGKLPEPKPHSLISLRQLELSLATEAIGVLAASELGTVLRLLNGVNRSIGAVREFAAHHQGCSVKPLKAAEAFARVQRRLAQTVPADFVKLVRATPGDIRVIADAHLEWLDIDGLPLALRRNVSRISVTPGNLFVQQVLQTGNLHLTTDDFAEVLVVSALDQRDPIRPFLDMAVREVLPDLAGRMRIRFAEVSCTDDLVSELNAFHGAMLIFDGHGNHEPGAPAHLMLKGVPLDIWRLLDKQVRVPPIVVLSACNTHAADRNHATTANGFLALGARAVLASVFPLDARMAAIFTARLLYRLAAFVPAAVTTFSRSLTWAEIMSGMLRMQLATEFLRNLERKQMIDKTRYFSLHVQANLAINMGANDPFADILRHVTAAGVDEGLAYRELRLTVATSSTISYVHIGCPETIVLDTPEHRAALARALASEKRGTLDSAQLSGTV